ncbi:class I SAM-dependent RNA methyltransferase [Pedobacter metabolipauper]|uniref:PG-1098 ferredoxin-like domain-containing protein n=1 Tax=Pedobacter metabolipauper TaxID=425513 RepID=A0A4R6SWU3_9SPHI|nr:hypothetical protein [Pedobacter metabolipauper]TDQ10964.1 hypothetical protein ATK78_0074 [Pedobacter metabolipauper]
MNKQILNKEVQDYIKKHVNDDVHRIAMAKSPFRDVEAKDLANQIAARNKAAKKLPSWYKQDFIYYPALLSIEQCSSETTAAYKAGLARGNRLIDLTGGFGVDSLYFAKRIEQVTHCEINASLSEIAAHNASILQQKNMRFLAVDGIAFLKESNEYFDTIYIDPARRSDTGKVFMLKDCSPNVVEHLDLMLDKADRILIKTAPLLDLTAGLKELKNVSEIHIVSVKNECKELIWIIEKEPAAHLKIVAVTLNQSVKQFSFFKDEVEEEVHFIQGMPVGYLYEPDTALLKSGAFNRIASRYNLEKLDHNTQLYTSPVTIAEFPGRIFKINRIISTGDLKKEKNLIGNVIVRSYPDKAETLVKKYKIKADNLKFLIFTQVKNMGNLVIEAEIVQHY